MKRKTIQNPLYPQVLVSFFLLFPKEKNDKYVFLKPNEVFKTFNDFLHNCKDSELKREFNRTFNGSKSFRELLLLVLDQICDSPKLAQNFKLILKKISHIKNMEELYDISSGILDFIEKRVISIKSNVGYLPSIPEEVVQQNNTR
jgi:hypothetical protein